MARYARGIRSPLDGRPGLPVTLLGFAYAGYGLVHLVRLPTILPVDWIVTALYQLLTLAVVFGGIRVSSRDLPPDRGLKVFGATVGFGFIGFVVAAALITLQFRKGAPLAEPVLAMAMASVTTAAIGVGIALSYVDLRDERANLATQHETVVELNKRLTVLHRVLRHNLRNELTVIRGHAELLLEDDPATPLADSLRTMIDHTGQVEALSENAYRLRQVWSQDVSVDQEVTELVESCVRTVRSAHPDADITTELPAHALVTAHPRLPLAVTEALENAVVHNDPESVAVTVRVRRIEGAEPTVEITVADTGRGIPPAELGVLDQIEEGPLRHGTGLGLWLIFWIVEQSGGTLAFESNEPRGTVVRMSLPAAAR